jgi:hypothetical protein
MIVVDICWTMFMIEVDKRKSVMSGIWAMGILLCGAFVTTEYVTDHRYIIPALIGSFIGTWGSVEWKKRNEQ